MANEEKLFEYIGEFGTFQLWLFFALASIVTVGMEPLQINFIAGEMEHWCDVEEVNHLPHSQQKYVAIPKDDDGDYEECHLFIRNYTEYSDEELMGWNRSIVNTDGIPVTECSSWIFDQSDFHSTYMAKFKLVCGDGWLISLVSTVYMLGFMVGTLSVGATSDAIGRKKCFFIFFAIKMVGCFISTFAPNYWSLVLGRFLIGLGYVGALANYVLMMEVVSDKYRSVLGSCYWLINSVGFVFLVWSAYTVRDEKYLQLIYTCAQLFVFLYWFVYPESPRWLLVNGKYKEAERVIRQIAAINRIELPEDLELEKIAQTEGEEITKGSCPDIFRYPRLRVRTIVVCLHWFTDSLLWYALTFNTGKLPGTIYLNTLLLSLVEVPANIIAVFCMNWSVMGRRWTNAGSILAAGIVNFCIIPAILADQGAAMTTLSIIGKFFVAIAFTAIYVYSAELYPTEVRNFAMGTASLCARVSGMTAPFIGGPLYDVWAPLPNLIFGVFGTVTGVLTVLLPETLGHEMFETIQEAEAFSGKTNNTSNSVFISSEVARAVDKPQIGLVGFTKKGGTENGETNTAFVSEAVSGDGNIELRL